MATTNEVISLGQGPTGENGQALFGAGFSTSAAATGMAEGNLDVFASSGVHDFNMAFDEDGPIRERACSWDLAMDHDVDPANDPMTTAFSSHNHALPTIPAAVGQYGAGAARSNSAASLLQEKVTMSLQFSTTIPLRGSDPWRFLPASQRWRE